MDKSLDEIRSENPRRRNFKNKRNTKKKPYQKEEKGKVIIKTKGNQGQSSKIEISNLNESVTGKDLDELFGKFGKVVKSYVKTDKEKKSLGIGYVIMKTPEEAQKATNEYDGAELDDKPIVVRIVEDKKKGGLIVTKQNEKKEKKEKKPKEKKPKKERKPLDKDELDNDLDSYFAKSTETKEE
eukprot:gene8790-738_t